MAYQYIAYAAVALQGISMIGQNAIYEQQAQINRYKGELQAKFLETDALMVEAQTADQIRATRRDIKRSLGESKANIGASGLLAEGSFMDVLDDNRLEAQKDLLALEYGGKIRAARLRANAEVARTVGYWEGAQAEAAGTAALVSGTANIIETAYNLDLIGGE